MLNDTDIKLISFASRKQPRMWLVKEVHYDEKHGSYCVHHLDINERIKFGTPFAAYNHAKNLLRKYKKQWYDAIIVIEEVSI